MKKEQLLYKSWDFQEVIPKPINSLQLFITNRCNKRCKACFNEHNLGQGDMHIDEYLNYIDYFRHTVDRIILMGGEPTLHPDLFEMITYNQQIGLQTTLYTNGADLSKLNGINTKNLQIRIGVYGSYTSEKALIDVPKTTLPVTVVYMLRRSNVDELKETATIAYNNFDCKNFYLSSIRDIAKTGSFWKDTEETLSLYEYYKRVESFVWDYSGQMNLHIATRGVIKGKLVDPNPPTHCRFLNIFPDGRMIKCPFDISKEIYTNSTTFGRRKCNKHSECLLQKIKLIRK